MSAEQGVLRHRFDLQPGMLTVYGLIYGRSDSDDHTLFATPTGTVAVWGTAEVAVYGVVDEVVTRRLAVHLGEPALKPFLSISKVEDETGLRPPSKLPAATDFESWMTMQQRRGYMDGFAAGAFGQRLPKYDHITPDVPDEVKPT